MNNKDRLSLIMPTLKITFSDFLKKFITNNLENKKLKSAEINKPTITPKFTLVKLWLHWLSREFHKKLRKYLELKMWLNIIGAKFIWQHTSQFHSAIFQFSAKFGNAKLPMVETHVPSTSVSWLTSRKETTSTEV